MKRLLDKVLIIDDDIITNYLSLRLINKLKIANEVKVAKNGLEALAELTSYSNTSSIIAPELIILDNYMPVMDGFEFIQEFRQLEILNKEEVVVIVLTAFATDEDRGIFKNYGVNEIFLKPLNEKAFVQMLSKYWIPEPVYISN